MLLAGCVTLQAPIAADQTYPAAWPRLVPLGDQCRRLTGTYSSSGVLADANGKDVQLSLLDALNLKNCMSADEPIPAS